MTVTAALSQNEPIGVNFMKNTSPKWTLHNLLQAIIVNNFTIVQINELEHGIKITFARNMQIIWYRKEGRTVVNPSSAPERERLCNVIHRINDDDGIERFPEAIPPTLTGTL